MSSHKVSPRHGISYLLTQKSDEVRSRLSPNLRDAAQVIDFVFQGALDKDPGYISQSNNVSTTVSEALASLEV